MAEWTTAYINDLPDSAFACIDDGGEKDEDGKTTPRSLRHYPHHDASGKLDPDHLANARARVNQAGTTACGHDHLFEDHKMPSDTASAKPTGREFRVAADVWPLADLEIRAEDDGLRFRGYAAVFSSASEDLGGFTETIRAGAFGKTLREKRTIKMFLNHNQDVVLASTRKGSLTLTEDDKGLLAEALLPDNEWGRPVADAVRRGDIDSMSFGFQAVKDSWSEDMAQRELVEVRLFEVSPVTAWPAYPATNASVRELAEAIHAEPDALADAFKVLRDVEARLTPDQHQLLIEAINSRFDKPARPSFASEDELIYRQLIAAQQVA